MRKTILLAAVAAMMSVNGFAQQNKCSDERCEERIEKRAECLAGRMGLDEKTREKFESDYKKMMQEHREVMKAHREAMKCGENMACNRDSAGAMCCNKKHKKQCCSNVDADKRLKSMLEMREKNLDIVEKYSKKMGKYLSDEQVLQVVAPLLCPGNHRQRGCEGNRQVCEKGRRQSCQKGQYQKGKPARTYDCMVRRPRKK